MTSTEPPPTSTAPSCRDLARDLDWSKTPLGPMDAWPETLRGYVAMVLDMPTPAIIFWGAEQTQIYNDGYAVIMGPRHPRYFGAPYRECWPDTYPVIYPWMQKVLAGETIRVERTLFELTRHGFVEEAYFTFTFSPLRDDHGRIAGIFQPVVEVTDAVLAERRLETLRRVAARAGERDSVRAAFEVLADNEKDIPFGVYYAWDERTKTLETAGGCRAERIAEPLRARAAEIFEEVRASGQTARIEDVEPLVGFAPPSAWAAPARRAVAVPLRSSGAARALGVLVFGVSPNLDFDERYRVFLDEVSRRIAANLDAEHAERTERALAARERAALADADAQRARLQAVFMQAPVAICILRGPTFVIELANPTVLRLWGRPLEKVLARPLFQVMPDVAGQGLESLLEGVLRTGERYVGTEVQVKIARLEGGGLEELFFNFVYEPMRDAAGRVDGVIVVATDVTTHVLARRQLEIAERRYRALVDANVLGVIVASESGITEANDVFLRMIGRTREDLEAGRVDWRAMTPPEHFAKDEAGLAQVRAVGRFEPFEKEYVRSDGTRVPILIGGARLRETPLTWISYVLDLTDRKHAQAALEETNAQLRAADRAKDEFLATMSHELRTPLNAILGWVSLLRPRPRDDAKLDRGLEVIERNARAQERLVADLLDMSRILSGKLALTLTRTSLWEIANGAVDTLRPAAEAKGVRLIVDIDPDLPSIVGDVARLQQVLWNLLSNALRHTPRGGRIMITGAIAQSGVRLSVEDTGQGIAPQHLARIFERFRQVDSSTTRVHGGLGLGLAIVRYLVEAHGGSVEAHSAGIGKGATFVVTFPVRALDTSAAPFSRPAGGEIDDVTSTPTDAIAGGADLAHVRVLVVEDDRDSLELVRTVLEAAGARVTAVSNAPDALAQAGPFDLIVSDIGLPEIDGFAMIQRLRAEGTTTPAIALTAYARKGDAERALRAGFQEHASKPIDTARLLETVRRWSHPARDSA